MASYQEYYNKTKSKWIDDLFVASIDLFVGAGQLVHRQVEILRIVTQLEQFLCIELHKAIDGLLLAG
jgi:hypothetical protein